jgi:hypothetical protein
LVSAFRDNPSLFAGDLFHACDLGHSVFAEEALPAFEAAVEMAQNKNQEPRAKSRARHTLDS